MVEPGTLVFVHGTKKPRDSEIADDRCHSSGPRRILRCSHDAQLFTLFLMPCVDEDEANHTGLIQTLVVAAGIAGHRLTLPATSSI